MATTADLQAQYIAGLKAIVAADPAIGPLVVKRSALQAQLAALAAQMKPIQAEVATLNGQIGASTTTETKNAVRALRILGSV